MGSSSFQPKTAASGAAVKTKPLFIFNLKSSYRCSLPRLRDRVQTLRPWIGTITTPPRLRSRGSNMETHTETHTAYLGRFTAYAVRLVTATVSRLSNASVFGYCFCLLSRRPQVRVLSGAWPGTLGLLGFPAFLCRTDVNAFYIKTPFSIQFLHRNCARNCAQRFDR